ncbi:hypothetical protein MKW94_004963 [Papaver nudicaule]|uniref:Uncharacterized protein n=1 Tax=Papaver nudicaule TaxID=74823 RepID=A0AA41VM86_PAPNU|nr:hypothetical protein [Papaver nudicaule]
MAAKFCKLMKLKSILKKWRSMGKHSRSISSSAVTDIDDCPGMLLRDDHISRSTPAVLGGGGHDLQPVYVGKSRRRYLISSHIIDHPLVRELVVRSSSVGCESELGAAGITFDCEVVMFEHLLWMIENSDPLDDHESSIDGDDEHELVDYYVCS